jgi:glycosyltransferase involved in cell wall biosynthesis
MTHVFSDARLVMAGNEFLANRARRQARWVEVVPTVVDTDRYLPGARETRDGFTIGWIGSPSTATYLRPLAEPLRRICAEGDARVLLVGAGKTSLPDVRAEHREWSEATEVEDIREFDVGIMPLPDTSWARGKCGFKLIQCMACGIPVVASPVGVNADLVDHGVNGFLAATPADWIAALGRLRDDPALRRQMGDAGRTKIEHHYSLRALAPRVSSLLRRATNASDLRE